jgi:hypothetical protein
MRRGRRNIQCTTGTNEIGTLSVLTDSGYVHVVVTRRGMGRSEREAGAFLGDEDVDDIEKVVDAWRSKIGFN